ncbi:hypothetical protein K469DRAFT_561981 [Zopfia rhizophila CBS 207.26]|uniref:Mitochondrial ATPase complex subunit ATP10 n=1 Tax=Zopfia rhizophila CBS 207.26 TaxID=1314779 RepID=A0A6A6EEV0_9PEZI|nr:hypothetical protein K469DRAFT_561981 [Zopfia rhizophila CBS 207.26]
MLKPRILSHLRSILLSPSEACLQCRRQVLRPPFPILISSRLFSSTHHLRAKDEEEFVPKPLGRPIGFHNPPQTGENTGSEEKRQISGSTWRERNLAKRKDLVESWGKNYFRDFKNIRKYRDGKTFMANPKIFRSDVALYFPNFRGTTLEGEGKADTTPVLKGKVSVVNVFSSAWGEAQAATFTGEKMNKELKELVEGNRDVAQTVDVNIEENSMKAWIIALFRWNLRRQKRREDWGRYFVVRRGVSDLIRETIGLLNGRVGYVYLVDQECKIRWAGSGNAEGTEREDLTRGFKRLIEDASNPKAANGKGKVKRVEKVEVEEELEAQTVNAGAS